MNVSDQAILDASREVREAATRRKAALQAVDAAKKTVATLERDAQQTLADLQAAEKRLRDISTGEGESMSMTSRTIEL